MPLSVDAASRASVRAITPARGRSATPFRRPADTGRPAGQRGDPNWVYEAVDRARQGDREALAALYSTFAREVFGTVRRILQDPYEAEDVTQQVFLKLMSILPRYERREVPFGAWLMRVSRNVALDVERRRRSVPCDTEQSESQSPRDPGQHLERLLLDAIQALPTAQRRVVVMRHVVGLSAPEVAARLGRTTGSVHALDQRGRRTLKKDLLNLGAAPTTRAGRVH